MGINASESVNKLKVYLRGRYTAKVSSAHILVVYAYIKSELARQKTNSGSEIFTLKNKVISSLTQTVGKILNVGSSGDEIREVLTFDLDG